MSDLIKNPFSQFEDKIDHEIPTLTLQIYQGINEHLSRSQESGRSANRASSATMCVRRRWYDNHGYKGKPLSPRKISNFILGDLSEKVLLYLIKKSAVGDLEEGKLYREVNFGEVLGEMSFQGKTFELYKQPEVSFEIDGIKITGHPDGLAQLQDGSWELIECKSAADYGFKEFQTNGPGDYLKQSHALMLSQELQKLNVRSVRFIYIRKSTGHVWDRVYGFDEKVARIVLDEFKASNKAEMPTAPYPFVKDNRGGFKTIPWQCQYCDHLDTCKPGYEVVFKKDQFGHSKPVYIYKE